MALLVLAGIPGGWSRETEQAVAVWEAGVGLVAG